jgi:hypothetical protein
VNGKLSISPKALTVTANNKTKVYGDANPPLTVSYSGFVNGQDTTALSVRPTAACAAGTTTDVGDVMDITVSGGTATNYSFTYVKGKLSITKAPLTVTAYDTTRVYGTVNPSFTMSYAGFKGNDTRIH